MTLADLNQDILMRKGNNLSLNLESVQKPRVNMYQILWVTNIRGQEMQSAVHVEHQKDVHKRGLGWTKIKWVCIEFIINVGSERFPLFLKILLALWASDFLWKSVSNGTLPYRQNRWSWVSYLAPHFVIFGLLWRSRLTTFPRLIHFWIRMAFK